MPTHVLTRVAASSSSCRFSIALLLWMAGCCGLCGLHLWYLNRRGLAVVYLFTFGLGGIGQALDWFRLGSMVRRANEPGPS